MRTSYIDDEGDEKMVEKIPHYLTELGYKMKEKGYKSFSYIDDEGKEIVYIINPQGNITEILKNS